MQTILTWTPDSEPTPTSDDLVATISAVTGVSVEGAPGAAYRPFHWRCPTTGARALGDIGSPPIEEEQVGRANSGYPGWTQAPFTLHLPLPVPHWHGLEALRLLEAVLARYPHLHIMDTEDNAAEPGGEDSGPTTYAKPRLLASWEHLHAGHTAGMRDLPRMPRASSVALWRYRRECERGREQHPEHIWSSAGTLLDDGVARAALVVSHLPEQPLALPPLDLLIIGEGTHAGAYAIDELPTAAGDGLGSGGCTSLTSNELTAALAHLAPAPLTRYRALDDDGWSD